MFGLGKLEPATLAMAYIAHFALKSIAASSTVFIFMFAHRLLFAMGNISGHSNISTYQKPLVPTSFTDVG